MGPHDIEVEIEAHPIGCSRTRARVVLPSGLTNLRKAGARLGQRTIFVLGKGDIVTFVLDVHGVCL